MTGTGAGTGAAAMGSAAGGMGGTGGAGTFACGAAAGRAGAAETTPCSGVAFSFQTYAPATPTTARPTTAETTAITTPFPRVFGRGRAYCSETDSSIGSSSDSCSAPGTEVAERETTGAVVSNGFARAAWAAAAANGSNGAAGVDVRVGVRGRAGTASARSGAAAGAAAGTARDGRGISEVVPKVAGSADAPREGVAGFAGCAGIRNEVEVAPGARVLGGVGSRGSSAASSSCAAAKGSSAETGVASGCAPVTERAAAGCVPVGGRETAARCVPFDVRTAGSVRRGTAGSGIRAAGAGVSATREVASPAGITLRWPAGMGGIAAAVGVAPVMRGRSCGAWPAVPPASAPACGDVM